MKDTIVQGLEQAYYNLVHMIAEFLPRFVVMLVIIWWVCWWRMHCALPTSVTAS